MPQPPSRSFTGREELLDKLAELLLPREASSIVALHGLAGVGKTQIALVYWRRYRRRYEVAEWVRARSVQLLRKDYRAIAARHGLRVAGQEAGDVVREWFERTRGWLLVLDGAPAPEALAGYLPAGAGSVLITSRHAAWRNLGEPLGVEPFRRDETIAFLRARTGKTSRKAMDTIAEQLGDLPLAVEEIATSIRTGRVTIGRCARRLRADPDAAVAPGGATRTVARVASSMSATGRASPAALNLLRLLSFVAPGRLDQGCLQHADGLLATAAARGAQAGTGVIQNLVAVLRGQSLVQAEPPDTVSVHRIVQAVVRERMTDDERRRWADAAVRLVTAAFPVQVERGGAWQRCEQLVAHALAAVGHVRALGAESPLAGRLLGRLGWYLWQVGNWDDAERHLEAAVGIAERTGAATAERTWLDNRLGLVLARRGRLEQAATVLGAALVRNSGPHAAVAELRFTLNTLGLVHQEQQRDNETQLVLEESAALVDDALSNATDDSTVTSLLARGRQLLEPDSARQARSLFVEAVLIGRRLWGPGHPEVALCLEHLGRSWLEQDDPERADWILARALRIDQGRYGRSHPRVAADLDALGLARKWRNPKAARELLESALAINTEYLGPDHPEVARNLTHLAELEVAVGNGRAAKERLTEAIRIYRSRLEVTDPRIVRARAQLKLLNELGL